MMHFNTILPVELRPYFQKEVEAYRFAFAHNQLQLAWHHLERAHIIGQSYPFAHSYIHWKMLQFGFHIKDFKEIVGQLPRLLVGGVKSFVGKVPLGNTGGANVPPLRTMEIPADIRLMFESVRK